MQQIAATYHTSAPKSYGTTSDHIIMLVLLFSLAALLRVWMPLCQAAVRHCNRMPQITTCWARTVRVVRFTPASPGLQKQHEVKNSPLLHIDPCSFCLFIIGVIVFRPNSFSLPHMSMYAVVVAHQVEKGHLDMLARGRIKLSRNYFTLIYDG